MADVDYGGPAPRPAHCGRGAPQRPRSFGWREGSSHPVVRARLRRGGRSRSCLRLCAGCCSRTWRGSRPARARKRARRGARAGSSPLVPRARGAEIHALGSELWALRTQEGEIFLRRAIARSGQGAGAVPLPDGSSGPKDLLLGWRPRLPRAGCALSPPFSKRRGGSGNAASGIEPRAARHGAPRRSRSSAPRDAAGRRGARWSPSSGERSATHRAMRPTMCSSSLETARLRSFRDGYHSWPSLETLSVRDRTCRFRPRGVAGAWALPAIRGVVVLTEWKVCSSAVTAATRSSVEGGLPKESHARSSPWQPPGAARRRREPDLLGTASALAWTPRGQLPPPARTRSRTRRRAGMSPRAATCSSLPRRRRVVP